MEISKRHVVRTQWGSFSLDEDSYRDYLEGKLWISWAPRKSSQNAYGENEGDPSRFAESKEVRELRSRAAQTGALAVLRERIHGASHDHPFKSYMKDIPIEEMKLSARAFNGLKRAGISTFGDLYVLIVKDDGLSRVRNIGAKSVSEISSAFFDESYQRLTGRDQIAFWQTIITGKTSKPE